MRMFPILAGALLVSASVLAQGTSSSKPAKAAPKVDAQASRKEARVTARNIAAEVRAPLTESEQLIATRVHIGSLPCELGQTVVLEADAAQRGFFHLRLGKTTYHVAPEETTTGAIRLEDKAAGIVWLQLANKSMLMNHKLGKRMADECMSPAQTLVAQAMLANPPASVLDTPTIPGSAASAPATTQP